MILAFIKQQWHCLINMHRPCEIKNYQGIFCGGVDKTRMVEHILMCECGKEFYKWERK